MSYYNNIIYFYDLYKQLLSSLWAFIFCYLERTTTFYNRYYYVKKYWQGIGNNWDLYLEKYPFLENLDYLLNNITETDENNNNNTNSNINNNLKIITWNLHHGYDFWNNYTFLEQVDWLTKQNADIICLQEVPDHMGIYVREIPVHYIKTQDILCRSLKMNYIIDHISNTMILSKYPIKKLNKVNSFMNCFTYGNHMNTYEITYTNLDKRIIVNNIHLANDITFYEQKCFFREYLNRYNELEMITGEYINHLDKDNIVLFCGDYNGYKTDYLKKYKKLEEMKTYPVTKFGFGPVVNLDYIYHFNKLLQDNTSITVDRTVLYSDHHPMKCIINNI
jgi:endonuclease/exonuclease/phosphatase family metal-dependent hydrolase